MKNLKILISTFFVGLILLQSCTAYKNNQVSLRQATEQRVKTKVTFNTSESKEYDYIFIEEGEYYGVGKMSVDELNIEEIISVKTKDRLASTLITYIPIAILIYGIILLIVEIDESWL